MTANNRTPLKPTTATSNTAPKHKPAPAPKGLGTRGRALWTRSAKVYQFRPDELTILEEAARIADLIATLDAELEGAPRMIDGSKGQPIVNPLITETRMQRQTLDVLLKSLKMPNPDDNGAKRDRNGRITSSDQGRVMASARWQRNDTGA